MGKVHKVRLVRQGYSLASLVAVVAVAVDLQRLSINNGLQSRVNSDRMQINRRWRSMIWIELRGGWSGLDSSGHRYKATQ